ncbi:MAG TPA: glycosyltransferase family 39 protein [Candidatus Angelobacter sp.]|nr:glycosyltransferase family 39 protein [Candidatus Angelobacter sp.]
MFQPLKEFQIRRPQIFAGLMLLAFLGQCVWVSASRKLSPLEEEYVASGFPHRPGQEYLIVSPFTGWVGALPFKVSRKTAGKIVPEEWVVPKAWLARVPFMFFGVWLGAALWWVARRLFDDAGGYVALGLYCSSPAMVMISSDIGPEVLLAWSIFGLIYTAIGVSHTLYAPRRKWLPRIVILGLSIGFSLATAPWSVTIVLLAFAFMLYLAPGRRRAATMVLLGGLAIGIGIYSLFVGLTGAHWFPAHHLITPHASLEVVRNIGFAFAEGFTRPDSYLFAAFFITALIIYGSWPRAQYFGNTAPLVSGFATVLLFAFVPALHIWSATLGLVFVFVFIGGVAADLLDTRLRRRISVILSAGFLLRAVLGVLALWSWIHNP